SAISSQQKGRSSMKDRNRSIVSTLKLCAGAPFHFTASGSVACPERPSTSAFHAYAQDERKRRAQGERRKKQRVGRQKERWALPILLLLSALLLATRARAELKPGDTLDPNYAE